MLVIEDLQKVPELSRPIALSIGNFAGVHRGHQQLLNRLRERATDKGTTVVLTFSNHPLEVLTGRTPAAEICSSEQKLKLLEKAKVDLVLHLKFTPELAKEPFDLFLRQIKEKVPFSFLILGQGATFGKGKKGDETHVKALEKELDFQAEYLPKTEMDGRAISSGWIREEIEKGNLSQVEKLLGRSYDMQIYKKV